MESYSRTVRWLVWGGLAVVIMFALQGCEDKGTCETAETEGDKKEKKEACCKDGKPGEGKPDEACCKKKDDELKKCLQDKAKELAKAGSKAAPSGGTPTETAVAPKAGTKGGGQLEVGDIKVNGVQKKTKLREGNA